MLNLLNTLRRDENGVILSAEIVIVGSILVIGMITGMTCLQQAVNGELRDVAGAIGALDQSYSFSSHRKPGINGQCCAYTAGSAFVNCEQKEQDCQHDLIGPDCCEGKLIVAAHSNQGCGSCGQVGCGGCGSAIRPACGSCGQTGCGGCGSNSGSYGPNDLNTGVKNFRVSEWPLSNIVPMIPTPDQLLYPQPDSINPPPDTTGACCPKAGDIQIPDHVW